MIMTNSQDRTRSWLNNHIPISLVGYRKWSSQGRVFLIVQKLYNMKKRKLTPTSEFRLGDLYLFHPCNPRCPASSSLWGFYDKRIKGVIYLEHSSHNLHNFHHSHSLPKHYRYYRLATRSELRDYMYNMGCSDIKRQGLLIENQQETL